MRRRYPGLTASTRALAVLHLLVLSTVPLNGQKPAEREVERMLVAAIRYAAPLAGAQPAINLDGFRSNAQAIAMSSDELARAMAEVLNIPARPRSETVVCTRSLGLRYCRLVDTDLFLSASIESFDGSTARVQVFRLTPMEPDGGYLTSRSSMLLLRKYGVFWRVVRVEYMTIGH